jgi:hypothetical protein
VAAVLDARLGAAQAQGELTQIAAGLNLLLREKEAGSVKASVVNLSLEVMDPNQNGFPQLVAGLHLAALQQLSPVLAVGNNNPLRSQIADHGLSVGALHLHTRGVMVWSSSAPLPRLVAPGHPLQVCKPGRLPPVGVLYVVDSGTSFSAALVSGALALLQEASGRSVDDCVAALLRAAYASCVGQPRATHRWGEGPLDAAAAFRDLMSTRAAGA